MPHRHLFPGLFILLISLGLQLYLTRAILRRSSNRLAAFALTACSFLLLCAGFLSEFQRVQRRVSPWAACWAECASLIWSAALAGACPGALAWRRAANFQPPRRVFLQAAGAALAAAPLAAVGFGIVQRDRFRLSEIDIPVPGLPAGLDGLRIVQITDIHLSPFLSEREFARAIDMANAVRAPLALVTGDLISRRGDPLDACLRQLARLRAEAGILGCLGNHEVYTATEDYVTAQGRRIGVEFLRGANRTLRFGSANLNFAGVDYQQMHSDYLAGARRLIVPGAFNILLSHNPDVFPVAAAQGYGLTIAGHTHGGQVNFEILHRNLNAARYFTPYVRGLYQREGSAVYVSSGLGTIGVPVRLGAPPEVSVLRLCAT